MCVCGCVHNFLCILSGKLALPTEYYELEHVPSKSRIASTRVNCAIKGPFLLHLPLSGPHKDDRNPHKKRQKERESEGQGEREGGIHFQDLIKSRPHPNPPFFRSGTKFPCVYGLPPPPPSPLPTTTTSLSLSHLFSLSTSCSAHTRDAWKVCISDIRCTKADWTVTLDDNILKTIINMKQDCNSKPARYLFLLDEADETHMSYLSFSCNNTTANS